MDHTYDRSYEYYRQECINAMIIRFVEAAGTHVYTKIGKVRVEFVVLFYPSSKTGEKV